MLENVLGTDTKQLEMVTKCGNMTVKGCKTAQQNAIKSHEMGVDTMRWVQNVTRQGQDTVNSQIWAKWLKMVGNILRCLNKANYFSQNGMGWCGFGYIVGNVYS